MSVRSGREKIVCGYIPLSDCASLVVAQELGFAAEEGIDLELVRETSWSNIRDKIALGLFDAAHMLAPMPVAMSMGLSANPAKIIAPMLLSANGDTIAISNAIAARLRDASGQAFFDDARAAAAALRSASAGRRLRIGVPWRFSTHACLIDYWLGRSGFALDRDITLTIVPPPYVGGALSAGEIDMFCVGEPWGSVAVEEGVAELLMPATAIWSFAPEKALGAGPSLAQERPEALAALLRALYRAAEWASQPQHLSALAEMLSRRDRLGLAAEIIERGFTGELVVNQRGDINWTPSALELFDRCATFPWRSQERWIAHQLAVRFEIDPDRIEQSAPVFRPDIYRQALGPIGVPMPAGSSKLEGALGAREEVSASGGRIELGPDQFFDGAIFDPDRV